MKNKLLVLMLASASMGLVAMQHNKQLNIIISNQTKTWVPIRIATYGQIREIRKIYIAAESDQTITLDPDTQAFLDIKQVFQTRENQALTWGLQFDPKHTTGKSYNKLILHCFDGNNPGDGMVKTIKALKSVMSVHFVIEPSGHVQLIDRSARL